MALAQAGDDCVTVLFSLAVDDENDDECVMFGFFSCCALQSGLVTGTSVRQSSVENSILINFNYLCMRRIFPLQK